MGKHPFATHHPCVCCDRIIRDGLALRVPVRRINKIVHGKQPITADTALRLLARYFDMSPRFWPGLQMDYDLDVAEDEMGDDRLREIVFQKLPRMQELQPADQPH